jgi:hypothetical protein
MQMDPKVAMIIKIVLGLATAVTSGTLSLTGLVSPQTNALIVAVCSSLIAILGIIMSAYSSSAPGPLAPPDPDVVVKAQQVANLPPTASPNQIAVAKKAATNAVEDHQP